MNYLKLKGISFFKIFAGSLILSSCGGVPEETSSSDESNKVFAVADILTLVAEENDVTRTLYTKAIVGAGKKQGLKFDEDWQDDDVEAGPLPALFLRGISSDIRKSDVPLGLYLGSDFPNRHFGNIAWRSFSGPVATNDGTIIAMHAHHIPIVIGTRRTFLYNAMSIYRK